MTENKYIYKDVSMPRISKDACTNFVRAVAISRASITSNFSLAFGFSEKQVSYQSIFFRIRFSSQSDLDKFLSLNLHGIIIKEPEKISDLNEVTNQ